MFNRLIYVFITYLVNKFNYTVTNTVTVTETVIVNNYVDTPVVRMDFEVYKHLEKQCSNMLVTSTTSEIEAGYKLGIATVLEKLRVGYVIEKG